MNIFFADIRDLTLDLQAPAEIDPGALQTVSSGAGAGLDTADAGQRQVIEFNTFFDQFSLRSPAPDGVVTAHPDGAWDEYLANAPVRVTTDGEPALLRPAVVAAALRVTTPATGSGSVAIPVSAGGSLPPGGNSLPGTVTVAPPGIVVATSVTAAEAQPMPAAPAASSIRAPLDAANPRPPAAAGLETAMPGEPRRDAAHADVTPARVIESMTAARPAPAGARRTAAGPDVPADARPAAPAPAPGTRAALPATDGKPSATVATTGAGAFELVAASGSARSEPAMARPVPASPAPGTDSRAAAPAEPLATPPRSQAADESAPAMSPRPTPATAPLPANGAAEMPLADAATAANRATEAAGTTLPAGGPAGAAPAMQATALPAASGAGLPPQLESLAIPRQAGAADWGNGLGERVSWMIDQRHNSATIRLDPPTLGKLDVQVRVADDATTITIQAQHAPTRELIEASAARLRDFLQDSGFHNVNVDVSGRQDQQQARAQAAPDARDGADGATPEPDQPGSTNADRGAAGDAASLIDTFA